MAFVHNQKRLSVGASVMADITLPCKCQTLCSLYCVYMIGATETLYPQDWQSHCLHLVLSWLFPWTLYQHKWRLETRDVGTTTAETSSLRSLWAACYVAFHRSVIIWHLHRFHQPYMADFYSHFCNLWHLAMSTFFGTCRYKLAVSQIIKVHKNHIYHRSICFN